MADERATRAGELEQKVALLEVLLDVTLQNSCTSLEEKTICIRNYHHVPPG